MRAGGGRELDYRHLVACGRVKSGFAHFDGSHRENFCAAVLLLAMEVDPSVALLVSQTVCARLGIRGEPNLLAFGREHV